jgi:hypothetical protein
VDDACDRRHPRVAGEGVAEGGDGINPVFDRGADVAAQGQPVGGGIIAGEPAGDLLLGLGGPQVALGEIVGSSRRLHLMRAMRSIGVWCG